MNTPPTASQWVAIVHDAGRRPAEELVALLEDLAAGGTRAVVLEITGSAAFNATAALAALALTPVPTVAALSGCVAGGASEVALACDIRVAGSAAVFSVPQASPRLMLLAPGASGELIAQEALALGLASEVADDATERATAIAVTIATRGPIATRLAKEAVWRGLEMPLPQALRFETDLTLLLQTTKDRAEGVRAFLEKRPPAFTGE